MYFKDSSILVYLCNFVEMYFDLRHTLLKTTVNTSSCTLATNHPGLPKMFVDTHSCNSHLNTHFV